MILYFSHNNHLNLLYLKQFKIVNCSLVKNYNHSLFFKINLCKCLKYNKYNKNIYLTIVFFIKLRYHYGTNICLKNGGYINGKNFN